MGKVVVEDEGFARKLLGAAGGDPKDPEWFLGAVVRVTGELRHVKVAPPAAGEEIVQMRSGDFWRAGGVSEVTLVKAAEVIEGTLERSKGFFGVAGKLVTREDLGWSLSPTGGEAGARVRLHGQSRTVVCEPNAQCLLEGSLPLFVVGRAERLP